MLPRRRAFFLPVNNQQHYSQSVHCINYYNNRQVAESTVQRQKFNYCWGFQIPTFNLTCLITLCLLLFNLLTGSFILMKLLFSKFTMTSSYRWIVVRSHHSFFSTYLLLLILSIIPSFSLVFKIGLVLIVFCLIGSHLISHLALRQSQSMIPSLHSLLFPVVYPKVPYMAHSFSLSILLLA